MSFPRLLATVALMMAGERAALACESCSESEAPSWALFPEAAGSFALALNLGLGSAVGSVGATFDYSRLGPLEVELGTGLGFTGVQASGMLKIGVWGTRTDCFVVGAGLAEIVSHDGSKVTGKPVWLNPDPQLRDPRSGLLLIRGRRH